MCARRIDTIPLGLAGWRRLQRQIMDIEVASYEPARRATPEFFGRIVSHPSAICLVALCSQEVVGFCFGAGLEVFADEHGVHSDPQLGRFTTFYSADVTVGRGWRGHGIGWRLKTRQVKLAREAGYRYIGGRARVGVAEAMRALNAKLGAREMQYFPNHYSDNLGRHGMSYYHIDLGRDAEEASPIGVLEIVQ